MQGRVVLGGEEKALDSLASVHGAKRTSAGWAVPLDDDAKGKIALGDASLLFQFVAPPPAAAKPKLPPGIEGGWKFFLVSVLGLSGVFLASMIASFVLQAGSVAWLVYMVPPPARVSGLDALPDRFVRILEPQPEVAPPDETELAEDGEPVDAEAEEEEAEEREQEEVAEQEQAPRTREEVREQAEQRVRQESALAAFYGGGEDATGPSLGFTDALADRRADEVLRSQTALGEGGGEGGIVSRSGLGTSSGAEGAVGRAEIEGGGSRVAEAATTERTEERETVEVRANIQSSDPSTAGSGQLDQQSLRSALRRRQGEIERCYERALAQNPNLRGRVVVQFTVGAGGRVVDARLAENTVNDEVGNCIVGRVRRWRFDEPQGGEASVAIPYILEPGN
jgi:TonB family protein